MKASPGLEAKKPAAPIPVVTPKASPVTEAAKQATLVPAAATKTSPGPEAKKLAEISSAVHGIEIAAHSDCLAI